MIRLRQTATPGPARQPYDYKFLRLLELSPFERRRTTSNPGGGWRFGTRRIADSVVDRLIASGRAARDGETIRLASVLERNNHG